MRLDASGSVAEVSLRKQRDGFRDAARRKPERYPWVSRGFATRPRRERRTVLRQDFGDTTLVLLG